MVTQKVVLTNPLSFDGDSDVYQAPNLVRRILSLFSNVRPGSDLTSFQIPPVFNIPKSHLQCYGESVYCVSKDLLKKCNNGENSLERFIGVVGWCISIPRPAIFGAAPYNPILGETHHVSKGSLNVLLEQVSHHPPVSALHATDENENIEIIWCQQAIPKFYGTKVEAEIRGKRELKLHKHGEKYVMNSPNLRIKLLPPGHDWVGNVKIKCEESGLEAELCFLTSSLFGRKASHSINGRIYRSSSFNTTLYEIHGHWNSIVTVKDMMNNGKERIIYDAKEVMSGLKSPLVKDPKGILASESAAVWSEVSEGILTSNWEKAKEAKKNIEATQREALKERNSTGKNWLPKYFNLLYTKDGGWDCSPIHKLVPPAPIIYPQ
ncbi:oxysterol-binding protein-related protein 4B-like [Mercurialis annua]|uniref:oxysterol-binding protein-related protein 4B-like n=1 Tax=Mercurialis annua TaxID=3986 RepID=UPI00215F685A|nr:oxysterol-binding protein-related protein 4B-like [Mercurialis annua]